MKTIHFQPDGEEIIAEVRSGFANPGSYILRLWERDSNAKAMEDIPGNFINADDDAHPLPSPVADNDGRIVESFVVLSPPPGSKQYFASLRIKQGHRLLDEISVTGESDQPSSVSIDLFAKLAAEKDS